MFCHGMHISKTFKSILKKWEFVETLALKYEFGPGRRLHLIQRPYISEIDGLKAVEAALAAYQSFETHKIVKIKLLVNHCTNSYRRVNLEKQKNHIFTDDVMYVNFSSL